MKVLRSLFGEAKSSFLFRLIGSRGLPCSQAIHTSCPLSRRKRISEFRRTSVFLDEGVASLPVNLYNDKVVELPDENTLQRLFNGIPYEQVPILHCHFTKNNTKLALFSVKNELLLKHTCQTEGFRNAKKHTTVAGQVTTLAMCKSIKRDGYRAIRLAINGLGPGRTPAIQTIQKEQIPIISITETTSFHPFPPRPQKMRRT
ncbi:mitochondrial ribosomal protein S11 [Brevipalpus obovatus]|uniref:mitochondrial ribosomal protein S11 n=1 Tax=Brevipalpus obovatus TaxID=246614 RepID=UPI003D9E750C